MQGEGPWVPVALRRQRRHQMTQLAQLLLGQEELVLGGPRRREQWEGRRKWIRGTSLELRRVDNVILPAAPRMGMGMV